MIKNKSKVQINISPKKTRLESHVDTKKYDHLDEDRQRRLIAQAHALHQSKHTNLTKQNTSGAQDVQVIGHSHLHSRSFNHATPAQIISTPPQIHNNPHDSLNKSQSAHAYNSPDALPSIKSTKSSAKGFNAILNGIFHRSRKEDVTKSQEDNTQDSNYNKDKSQFKSPTSEFKDLNESSSSLNSQNDLATNSDEKSVEQPNHSDLLREHLKKISKKNNFKASTTESKESIKKTISKESILKKSKSLDTVNDPASIKLNINPPLKEQLDLDDSSLHKDVKQKNDLESFQESDSLFQSQNHKESSQSKKSFFGKLFEKWNSTSKSLSQKKISLPKISVPSNFIESKIKSKIIDEKFESISKSSQNMELDLEEQYKLDELEARKSLSSLEQKSSEYKETDSLTQTSAIEPYSISQSNSIIEYKDEFKEPKKFFLVALKEKFDEKIEASLALISDLLVNDYALTWARTKEWFYENIFHGIHNHYQQRQIRHHKKHEDKKKKDSLTRRKLHAYIETAGFSISYKELLDRINYVSIFLAISSFIYFVIHEFSSVQSVRYFIFTGVIFCVVGYPVILLTVTLVTYIYTDLRVLQRKEGVEKHFPEFLHVVAANIRAGMVIDQALWRGARPQFGILSKEIEIIAKKSMIGQDLTAALQDFGRKYDSKILRRSISLIVEGMKAGSEIGEILENIALNIEDIELRKQSMAANVTQNVIFIVFAVLIAAPALFAVATQLLTIVQKVGGKIGGAGSASSKVAGASFALSTDAVRQTDFLIFCIIMLVLTCIMSTIIISAIKTGKAWSAVREMPIYIAVSVTLFLILRWLLSFLFGKVI